ncbi:MAG: putative metal-dependent hydrolase [Bacteroidetes bacterium]|nr:putative metal-dependent hydrolase [Bacteroidota bacterium]
MENLQYPIGKFQFQDFFSADTVAHCISDIEKLPGQMQKSLSHIAKEKYAIPYRPNGWNAVQLVNHIADSHANALIRFKLGITEDYPTVKPYREELWATLPDGMNTDLIPSLNIIDGVHKRLVLVISNMQESDFQRKVFHPEKNADLSLYYLLQLYAWHGKHHLGHLEIIARN